MKKSLIQSVVVIGMLLSGTLHAQVKNAVTENVKVYGNCGMCKKNIEKAGTVQKEATVVWDEATKIARITYDPKKTNQAAILKRIALAGYDNEQFLAPDNVYENLHGCCQYDREAKTPALQVEETVEVTMQQEVKVEEVHHHQSTAQSDKVDGQSKPQLPAVLTAYFAIKNAMVQTDGVATAAKAKELLTAIQNVDMGTLTEKEHTVWMKVMNPLTTSAKKISNTKAIETQRAQLDVLSKNMLELVNVTTNETPTYYQFCPMANDGKGAHWLSKEKTIENPYYGSKMMRCGSVVKTINK